MSWILDASMLAVARAYTVALVALAALLAGAVVAADEPSPRVALSLELYDAGDYAGARKLLEELDGEGAAGGASLYRLYYVQRATGDAELSQTTLKRAAAALEQESAESFELEVGFYLASAYLNLGRGEDARKAAAKTLERIESGAIEPKSGVDMFRLGKLYVDQGDEIQATDWYRRAVDSLREEGTANATYIVWASRFLADQAQAMDDFSAAEMHLTDVVRFGKPTYEELDRLAVVRIRNQMYRAASKAWDKALPLNPSAADRSRYCSKLAMSAARLPSRPENAPSGQPWGTLTRTELEDLLKAQAQIVREARLEAIGETPPSEERETELRRQIRAAKPVFVIAALEYALQGHSIREAAFFGGYAPLVFHSREWRLYPPELSTADDAPPAEAESD